jgi:hypothetical protein
MHWLLGRKSQLSLSNKILLYKTILKSNWTYGIQHWGTASNIQRQNPETFPIESPTSDRGRTIVCTEHYYPTRSPHANRQGRN